MHVFFPVELLKSINIVIDNKVRNNRSFTFIKRHILVLSTDHLFAVIPGELRTGVVPEDNLVIPVNDECRHWKTLYNPLYGLLLPIKLLSPFVFFSEVLQLLLKKKTFPSRIENEC